MKYIFISILLSVLLCSCGRRAHVHRNGAAADTAFYFSGEFSNDSGVPRLLDCATGVSRPVAMEGRPYLRMTTAYLRLRQRYDQPLYVELRGRLLPPTSRSSDTTAPRLLVDTLLKTDTTALCDPRYLLPGMYEASMEKTKMNLLLRGDYTFILREFELHGAKRENIFTGVWGRLSKDRIVLDCRERNGAPDEGRHVLMFNPDNRILTEQLGKIQAVYTPVYL